MIAAAPTPVDELRHAADTTLQALRAGVDADVLASAMVVEMLPRVWRYAVEVDTRVAAALDARDAAASRFAQARVAAASDEWLLTRARAEVQELERSLAAMGEDGEDGGGGDDVAAAAAMVCEQRVLDERVKLLERSRKELADVLSRREKALDALRQKGAAPLEDIARLGSRLLSSPAAAPLPPMAPPLPEVAALPDALFVLYHVVACWGKASVAAVASSEGPSRAVAVVLAPGTSVVFSLLSGLGVVAVCETPVREQPVLAALVDGDTGQTLPTLRARYFAHTRQQQSQQADSSTQRTYRWAQWLAGIPGDQAQQPPPAASAGELLDRIQRLMLAPSSPQQ